MNHKLQVIQAQFIGNSMTSIETQLLEMEPGETKLINGCEVLRYGDDYLINKKEKTLNDAIKIVSKNKAKGFPYNSVAFILVKPPSKVLGHFQIKNKKEHKELLEKAKQKQALVYYADVIIRDGKYFASHPWVVDFDSVDQMYGPVEEYKPESNIKDEKPTAYQEAEDTVEEQVEEAPTTVVDDQLSCPFCGKKMNSTPGRTLHVKSKHPDKYEEYLSSVR